VGFSGEVVDYCGAPIDYGAEDVGEDGFGGGFEGHFMCECGMGDLKQ